MLQNDSRTGSRRGVTTILNAFLCLSLLAGAGCGTLSGPASASFASVTIEGHNQDEIAAAAIQAFAGEGYTGGRSSSGQLIFEKEASRATSFAREGFVSTYYGGTTINRVRADIVPLGGNKHRLQCKAFMVTGGSDTFFQDETPLGNIRRAPYQMLLNKVKDQLK